MYGQIGISALVGFQLCAGGLCRQMPIPHLEDQPILAEGKTEKLLQECEQIMVVKKLCPLSNNSSVLRNACILDAWWRPAPAGELNPRIIHEAFKLTLPETSAASELPQPSPASVMAAHSNTDDALNEACGIFHKAFGEIRCYTLVHCRPTMPFPAVPIWVPDFHGKGAADAGWRSIAVMVTRPSPTRNDRAARCSLGKQPNPVLIS